MISTEILSACRPETVLTVTHAGLSFNEMTDAEGRVSFNLPAMNERATVEVSFPDGASASDTVVIRGVERNAHAGIAWDGLVNLDLNAFEFGAFETDDGHVWEGNARTYRASRRFGGGYLTSLGIPGLRQAEIYTLPYSRRTPTGVVAMSIRVGDGSQDCERPVDVETVSNVFDLSAGNRDITLNIGACDAPIERLTFDTVVRDIVVAQR
jgi:hypothetical protein